MRKLLISLLLAGVAATPAMAGPRDWSNHQQAQEDRQQAREERQQAREDRQQARQERNQSNDNRPAVAPRPTFEPQTAPRQQAFERPQFNRPPMQSGFDPQAARDARRESIQQQRADRVNQQQQRMEQRAPGARLVQNPYGENPRLDRPTVNFRRDRGPLVVSATPRPGTQPPMPEVRRATPQVQWNTSWRNDRHYDWKDYRRHHRSIFHFGFYYDPFGWDYFPYQIGWRMWPSYYSQQFWINDPWMYRLPYAPPGYRWIRYWDDALLIDTWSGTVVDVIPNFFW